MSNEDRKITRTYADDAANATDSVEDFQRVDTRWNDFLENNGVRIRHHQRLQSFRQIQLSIIWFLINDH